LAIRQFTEADIPFAMELKNIAGWNQVEADWQGYLDFEPEGCFLAEINGRQAGTATAIRYGTEVGWVGMVLVHPELRRFGIGKALLERTISYLHNLGVSCIKLDATPMGKTVYIPLGFVDEYELERYQGVAGALAVECTSAHVIEKQAPAAAIKRAATDIEEQAPTGAVIVPITEELLADLVTFDTEYFGVAREEMLRKLAFRDRQYSFCIQEAGRVTGYLMAHQGHNAVQVGPWVAATHQAAEALFEAFIVTAAGQQVFLDMPCLNNAGKALIDRHGFTVQRGFSRMYRGDNRFPGYPEGIYGTSGAEKG
jgi:GNAT superfamily N-acetyltransferase